MLPTIYVGLAVTSRDATTTATALFDHIIVGPPNDRPVVVLTDPRITPCSWSRRPSTSARPRVTPMGSWRGWTSSRVRRGSDRTRRLPYPVTWAGVLAGDYRLRAVVWDDKAAAGISTVRSILVALPGGG